jgi:hypothetical protein
MACHVAMCDTGLVWAEFQGGAARYVLLKTRTGGRQGKRSRNPASRPMPGKGPDKLKRLMVEAIGSQPSTMNYQLFQVDMMEPGLVQLLAPVLPPMARARTRYVVPGTRLEITIRNALVEMTASFSTKGSDF